MKNFWLKFAIQEALGLLTVYGTAQDPALASKIAAAAAALQDLINSL